jgi:LmbE family N-acetylglucosaminyl deacetylase
MLKLRLPESSVSPLKILCLGSHCDDIEIGCGGTLLNLTAQGRQVEVYWAVFSSDQVRAREARESAERFLERVNTKTILIQDFRNSFFPFVGAAVKEAFERLKEDFAPDLIFTHQRHDLHQDHQLISQLTWNTFRDHLILEYEIPKYDGDLGAPTVFTHLDESLCRRKIDYLMTYFKSQLNKHWFDPEAFWALLRLRGMEANAPSKYAEAFYCRKSVLDWNVPSAQLIGENARRQPTES